MSKPLLSDTKFAEQHTAAKEFVTSYNPRTDAVTDEGNIPMQFWLYGKPDDPKAKWKLIQLVISQWTEEMANNKEKIFYQTGVSFARKFPHYTLVNITQIAEGWAMQLDKDSPEEDKYVRPSQAVDRQELMVISTQAVDSRISMCTMNVRRNRDGEFEGYSLKDDIVYDPKQSGNTYDMQNAMVPPIYEGFASVRFKKEEP